MSTPRVIRSRINKIHEAELPEMKEARLLVPWDITLQPGTAWKKKASGPIFGLKNASELWPLGASADVPDSPKQACRKDTPPAAQCL